jgi:hypothetical protein
MRIMNGSTQTPTPPNEWLYRDITDTYRHFTDKVYLADNDEPWLECTNDEKEQWEKDHPEPEPEPEPEQ